jgi:hypothetical protein
MPSDPVSCLICRICQFGEHFEELLRLAAEQPHGGQKLPRARGLGRANNRTDRELSVQEYGGLRHDQVSIEVLGIKGRRVQVWKYQSIRGVGQRRRIARLVLPGLKVHRLRRADTQQDAQHLPMSDPLRQRRVETGATLFDRGKMKARCVGDRLEGSGGARSALDRGNRRKSWRPRRILPHD